MEQGVDYHMRGLQTPCQPLLFMGRSVLLVTAHPSAWPAPHLPTQTEISCVDVTVVEAI